MSLQLNFSISLYDTNLLGFNPSTGTVTITAPSGISSGILAISPTVSSIIAEKGTYIFTVVEDQSNLSFTFNAYFDGTTPNTEELDIDFQVAEYFQNTPLCPENIIVYTNHCSNTVTVINPLLQPETTSCWKWPLSELLCGQSVTKGFYSIGNHPVELTVERCLPTGEFTPGCCGQQIPVIECYSCVSTHNTPTTTYTIPNFQILASCSTTNTKSTTKDCIDGCGGCGCDETAMCKCVPLNNTVTITLTGNINTAFCENTSSIVTTVNGNQIDSQTVNTLEDFEPLELTVTSEGSYEIVVTITNCCGQCSATHTFTSGSPLYIERVKCRELKIVDNRNFSEAVTLRVDVLDLDNNLVIQYTKLGYTPKTTNINLYSDGIFIIAINEVDEVGIVLNTKKFVVYEFCSLIECLTSTIKNKLCVECTDCLETKSVLKEMDNKLKELEILSAAFYSSMSIQYGKTFGYMYYDEQYLGILRNTKMLCSRIAELCGECKTLSTKCSSCNGV